MSRAARSPGGTAPCEAPENLLFVYGTLRRGGSNDIAKLVPAARRIADTRMRGRLFDLGRYPAAVADPDGPPVLGELYAIPDGGWVALDRLEEVVSDERPDGEYFRVAVSVEDRAGRSWTCQVYVANPAVMRLDKPITGGDWIAYAANARGAGAGE